MNAAIVLLLVATLDATPPADAAPAATEVAPTDVAPTDVAPTDAPGADVGPTDVAAPAAVAPTDVAVEASAPALGDPTPLTHRALTLPAFGVEGSAHLGLVGTAGPTRFVNELRFAPTNWLELRTSFLPIPASLMARARVFDTNGPAGSFVVDGGLAYADLTPLFGTLVGNDGGWRAHLEAGLTWSARSGDRLRAVLQLRARTRLSTLEDDEEVAVAGAAHLDIDLRDDLGLSFGLGLASTLDTPVRELQVTFTEIDRPGMSWLLDKQSGDTLSLTAPIALVYGVTEGFDVNVFVTPQLAPQLAVVCGAGLRVRWLP